MLAFCLVARIALCLSFEVTLPSSKSELPPAAPAASRAAHAKQSVWAGPTEQATS